ncbi:hypothetical protein [Novipirellula sp.]|uniref:hypothetical protein n=1 Tax=Novipirellula sp. TaxID=2795430 RepID=UPI003566C9AD
MNRLDWDLIYRVSQHSRIATDAEIDEIKRSCGELPQDYALFVKEFGYGSLDDIDVLNPEAITEQTPYLRKQVLAEWLSFCDSFDESAIIPSSSSQDAIPFAKTAWGDYYFSSPSQPGTLWHIWRSHDWADSSPTQIPLGFGNLFLHRFGDGSIEELGPSSPVFRPAVDTNMQQRLLSPIGSIHTLKEFLDRCEELIQPSRMDRDEYGALMFAVDLGAEFRFGKRKASDAFVVTSIYPPEQEVAISRMISTIVGSEFKSQPFKQE